jgi:hypothetical protein
MRSSSRSGPAQLGVGLHARGPRDLGGDHRVERVDVRLGPAPDTTPASRSSVSHSCGIDAGSAAGE